MYFRFGKLKCKVLMKNEKGEVVCSGTIAGMIV
jgi:3-hydroxyacyl-[acyl-carrier-protein] dehydratase